MTALGSPVAPACTGCGARLKYDQRYCVECGAKRAGPAKQAAAATGLAVAGTQLALVGARDGTMSFVRQLHPAVATGLLVLSLGIGVFVGAAFGPTLPGMAGTILLPGNGEAPAAVESTAANALGKPAGSKDSDDGEENDPSPAPAAAPPADSPAEDPPPEPEPEDPPPPGVAYSGTVVHINDVAGSYVFAQIAGPLVAVHSDKLPALRRGVDARLEPLVNSTFDDAVKPKFGAKLAEAVFTGQVTWVDPQLSGYVLSSVGSSVPIRVPEAFEGTWPVVGEKVAVTVTFAKPPPPPEPTDPATETLDPVPVAVSPAPDLDPDTLPVPAAAAEEGDAEIPLPADCAGPPESKSLPQGAAASLELVQKELFPVEAPSPVTKIPLEGIVEATCTSPKALLVSADDTRRSAGSWFRVRLGKGLTADRKLIGRSVALLATFDPQTGWTAVGLARDDGANSANNPKFVQGEMPSPPDSMS